MARNILTYFGSTHADFLHADGLRSTGIIIEHLEGQSGDSILEIGFGTGATLVELAHRLQNAKLHGLERSQTMLEIAKKRIKASGFEDQISLHKSSDTTYLFSEDQFDKVYVESVLAIQSDEDLKHILQSVKRWLKPGGLLICNETIWMPHVPSSTIHEINQKCLDQFGIIQSNGSYPYSKDWEKLFQSMHFEIIQSNAIRLETDANFEQHKKSKLFTRKGKIRSKFNRNLQREWKEYERAMNEIIPPGSELMEGSLSSW